MHKQAKANDQHRVTSSHKYVNKVREVVDLITIISIYPKKTFRLQLN